MRNIDQPAPPVPPDVRTESVACQALLEWVLDHHSDLICRLGPNAIVEYANAAWCRFYNLDRATVVGTPFVDLLPPERQRQARDLFLQVATLGQPLRRTCTSVDAQGQRRRLAWTIQPCRDSSTGEVVSVQCMGRDLEPESPHPGLHQRVAQGTPTTWLWDLTTDQLQPGRAAPGSPEGATTVRTPADLLALVRPEDRARLVSLFDGLRQGISDNGAIIGIINQAQPRFAQVFGHVLPTPGGQHCAVLGLIPTAPPPESPQSSTTDLNTVLQDSQAKLLETAGPDHTLTTQLHPALAPVNAPADAVRALTCSLVALARKAHGPFGGRIQLTTGNPALDPNVVWLARGLGGGPSTGVQVAMPGRPHAQGIDTMAGMDTVVELVQALGGDLTLGTDTPVTLTVRLPTAPRTPEAPITPQPHQVLVVDDDPIIRRLTGRVLKREGHHPHIHSTAEQGLRAFIAEPAAWSCAIIDLSLPGTSGATLIEALRRQHPTLPVVVMSGFADMPAGLAQPGLPTRFLSKPFRPDELMQAMASVLEG